MSSSVAGRNRELRIDILKWSPGREGRGEPSIGHGMQPPSFLPPSPALLPGTRPHGHGKNAASLIFFDTFLGISLISKTNHKEEKKKKREKKKKWACESSRPPFNSPLLGFSWCSSFDISFHFGSACDGWKGGPESERSPTDVAPEAHAGRDPPPATRRAISRPPLTTQPAAQLMNRSNYNRSDSRAETGSKPSSFIPLESSGLSVSVDGMESHVPLRRPAHRWR